MTLTAAFVLKPVEEKGIPAFHCQARGRPTNAGPIG